MGWPGAIVFAWLVSQCTLPLKNQNNSPFQQRSNRLLNLLWQFVLKQEGPSRITWCCCTSSAATTTELDNMHTAIPGLSLQPPWGSREVKLQLCGRKGNKVHESSKMKLMISCRPCLESRNSKHNTQEWWLIYSFQPPLWSWASLGRGVNRQSDPSKRVDKAYSRVPLLDAVSKVVLRNQPIYTST